ncbi:M15 family metallopeptidase [Nodularia harveyana UHCC-0300]|uniref:M15 family metallopeptidase n=1 Tax=Nodularia harveyana UHCC-0300 TaxID=2974287 RepID=A0ABU5UBD9_9CYAN|nr:M15 family metallopeptidase [Nodularia harveyana]MEA5579766.1 M15 family metallopeptidase [Nodularia harveyana UHCC-0300]
MNKDRFSGQPHNLSGNSSEDIPEALRDSPEVPPKGFSPTLILLFTGVGGVILLGLIASFWFLVILPRNRVDPQTTSNNTTPTTQPSNSVNTQENNIDSLLGHLTYPEAPESELLSITADGRIRLRTAAAARYQSMSEAARSDGVILVPISGFRSIEQQEQLFFGVGAKRNQTPAERAIVSAPPGHSEHHTGYAVDIGDGAVPATNLQTNFENTKAFQWLEGNAARFGFELSFPKNNSQGVSYEPWHWRFVGDRHSLELFYKAKNLNTTQP